MGFTDFLSDAGQTSKPLSIAQTTFTRGNARLKIVANLFPVLENWVASRSYIAG